MEGRLLVRISYSRYSAYLTNPERYRLQYVLGLTPEGDESPSTTNIGRRRGRCFHEIYEGKKTREELIETYGLQLVERCERMKEVVPDLGPLVLVETSFDIPIGDGKHSIVGRIDHGFTLDDQFRIGDFKSTKGTRTKKDFAEYLAEMETSSQSHFYLYAVRHLGMPTELFRYHVVLDRKDKDHKPTYFPLDLPVTGPATLDRTMAEVYAACEAIEFLRKQYGEEKPWPHSNNWPCCGDKFFCGYSGICGRLIPKGATPTGYTYRWAEQLKKDTE
jgi:hypothetical protein